MPGIGISIGVPGRGGGDNTPVPYAVSGLVAWFDATIGVTKDGSNRVSAWSDRVNSHSISQAVGGSQPLYSATGFNSRPGIQFVKTRPDYLVGSSTLATLVSGSDKPYTLIMSVVQVDGATYQQFAGWGSSGGTTPNCSVYIASAAARFRQAKRDDLAVLKSSTVSVALNTTPHIFSQVNTGTLGSTWVDGSTEETNLDLDVGTTTLNRFALGAAPAGGTPSNITFADVLVYDSALAAADRNAIEKYLGALRGVTVA